MNVDISNKAVILTDFEKLVPLVSEILGSINVDIFTGDSSLKSSAILKKRIAEEGNLSFLKKDIISFIEKNGYPFLIFIDMKIGAGINGSDESIKVLKTLILSYLIILQSEQYNNISCNLLVLVNNKDYNHLKAVYKQPQNMLALLKTNDERINSIINEYTTNSDKFKKNFNILLTDAEQESSLIKSEIVLFANMIKSKEKLKNKLTKPKSETADGPKISAAEAADVVLRSGSIFFKNGEAPAEYDEKLNLEDKEVYILGNFTSYTRLAVIEKLYMLMKRGFGNEVNFKKGDILVINIPKESTIDSTTSITLAQLISKELIEYKNIKIKAAAPHYQMMQKSQGFSMIQKHISSYEAGSQVRIG